MYRLLYNSILLIILISPGAHAYQWSGAGTVTNLYISPNFGGVNVKHTNQDSFTTSSTGCSNVNWLQLESDTSDQEIKDKMYSLLLALYMSGKEVTIRVNGCTNSGYPSIDYVSAK